jgi:hypothetical protein
MAMNKYRRFVVLGAVFPVLILGIVFFYSRSPVLFVTDTSFDVLYGVRRIREKQIELSLRFFRRIKTVSVAENIGTDMLVFAVEEAYRSPYGVLFPYRYYEAAGRYAAQFPQVPVVLFGGRIREAPEEGGLFIATDIMTDLYRAGRCAAIFAQRGSGRILFYQDNSISSDNRETFLLGLREQGFEGDPLFVNAATDYAVPEDIACVVLTASSASFLERNLPIPVILFSWIDPALTARGVKIIFDDSPWAMAARTITMLSRGEWVGSLSSKVLLPRGRIPEKGLLREIQAATALYIPE